MSMKLADLKNLGRLADFVLDRELANLAQITGKRDDVRNHLSGLERELLVFLSERSAPVSTSAEPLAQHDRDWQEWRRQKRRELNVSLAAIEAEREAARVVAKTAFGRVQAVEKLVQRSHNKALKGK
ncbi:MAG: hypothetical protein GY945_03950 [Rhodobacteraceae bacterium]|nr:hypothetical protein [Paracoccaceae bacterium]